jgi:hypothetical protein
VAYFDQIIVIWYLGLAMVGSLQPSRQPAAQQAAHPAAQLPAQPAGAPEARA